MGGRWTHFLEYLTMMLPLLVMLMIMMLISPLQKIILDTQKYHMLREVPLSRHHFCIYWVYVRKLMMQFPILAQLTINKPSLEGGTLYYCNQLGSYLLNRRLYHPASYIGIFISHHKDPCKNHQYKMSAVRTTWCRCSSGFWMFWMPPKSPTTWYKPRKIHSVNPKSWRWKISGLQHMGDFSRFPP